MRYLGLTHVYYGDGQGKTTAALGLALRAIGRGAQVVLVQFFKNMSTGELAPLESLGVSVFRGRSGEPPPINIDRADEETREIHDRNLFFAVQIVRAGDCDLLILDEGMDALQAGLVDEETFLDLLNDHPETELVVTGHVPDRRVLERADYITRFTSERHPYERGIPARPGIEY